MISALSMSSVLGPSRRGQGAAAGHGMAATFDPIERDAASDRAIAPAQLRDGGVAGEVPVPQAHGLARAATVAPRKEFSGLFGAPHRAATAAQPDLAAAIRHHRICGAVDHDGRHEPRRASRPTAALQQKESELDVWCGRTAHFDCSRSCHGAQWRCVCD
ncbi:hypothetical protein [Bradyrhizobium oligotrophicum]|uniref:hypothetical protein n=1 Tax=Bradyrhizobium oligotrophicum TaxID=44255 RepID=UPI001181B216|nr:hypothetical protein [Bradyrhizobium oligotrophicum]